MTVSVSNTNLSDSFNSWRLNTNFAATVISNNVVTVARDGSANRGGVAKGNGHIAGTFTANELRTTTLRSGNTSDDGGWLYVNSNTSINATSLTVTANTIFQGNVNFLTSGTDRVVLGDISRVRVTGGSQGQFLRIDGESDTPNFKSLTLRDISDLSSNSADIILSGSNSTFSDNGDSPAIKFADTNGNSARIFMASDIAGDADLHVVLADAAGDSTFAITDSSNNIVGSIDSAGNIVATTAFLPDSDDSVDLGSSGLEFKDAYIDGVAYIDELSLATGAGQGVATSLIPKTDAVGNLGSTNRKWGTLFADTTNGGAGVFNTLGVSGAMTVNGAVTFNGDLTLNGDNLTLDGNTVIGDASTDTVTFTAQVDSDFDPQTGSQRDMGATNNRWHNIYANNVLANNITTDNNLTVLGDLSVSGSTTISSGQVLSVDSGVFNTFGVLGQFTANGNVDLGNATTDSITVTGQFDSALIPITDDTYDLGTASKQWQDLYIDGTASIDTLTVDELATFNGDRVTVSGNGFFSDSIDVADSIDVTNSITNDGTVMLGKNGKLHANNTITNGTLTTAMLANTMNIPTFKTHGSASQVPVISVNGKGQVIGISNTSVAGVTSFTYTAANNDFEIGTATGTTFNATISDATASVKGVASFDSDDFDIASGAVSLKNATSGAVLAINGTANEVNVSRSNGTVTVGLPDDITVTGQLNVGENVIVSGNLVVQGTTTTVESETVRIADNIIVLNSNEASTPSQNGGITIERGTSTNYSFVWDEGNDRWTVGDRNLVANTFIGNASTATKLETGRTIGMTGDVVWTSASFDGSGNVTGTATIQPNSVALGTDTTGNYVATIATGTGLDGASSTEGGTPTISLDLNELPTSTNNGDGDLFIVVDSGGTQRKLTKSNINISEFNNNAGFTTTTGTVTSVTVAAGNGLTGGGTITSSGTATLNIGAGTGVTVAADQISIGQDVATSADVRFDSFGVGTNASGTTGEIRATNNITAFFSDDRLKTKKGNIVNALEKVKSLNGFYYNANETAEKLGYSKDEEHVGVSAQEVAKIMPQVVKDAPINSNIEDADYKTVQYERLIPLLVEAIKDLSDEVERLKSNK